ncbi:TetR/AcrR family transcriptional regulator [Metabacillus litoralis]|uniref:TetR/AcrR family transcriptional regulator n=1 Tax=Metabacillus litoralis TaxID=152268 RepID=UPI00203B41A0|nr:TetR/AcrR family transcriptional regulator [Metabacillus litoralis]MCM3410317.1 TetR/AcrR family transcriptional regulator [Metabacillus litoralis]
MKEKEKKIIEAAVSIFATKGYSATSIQEIVDACGISKGAFYLYFKSKDALLLAAFKYQFQLIQSKVDSVPVKDLSPRDAFVLQLKTQLEEIQKNKEFIIMQTREQAIPINSEIEDFIKKMSQNIGRFYHRSLHAIYGPKINLYIFDLNMILQGIVQSYLKLIIFDLGQFDLHKLAVFVLRRADDLVEGYLKSDEEPILSDEFVCQLNELYPELTKDDLIREISLVKKKVDNEAFLITLDVIEEEINEDSPRLPVIRGMLSNIKNDPDLEELIAIIEHYFKLK